MTIAIGHSTQENPVTGVAGIRYEEQLTEPVAEEAARLLRLLGYDVRTNAPHSSATAVKDWANSIGAALLVDIHTDATGVSPNTKARGTSAFWNTRNGSSAAGEKLARCLFERVGAVGGVRRTVAGRSDLVVLYGTTMPAALVELEFHDRADTANFVKAHWLNYGAAVARAICDYLGDYRPFIPPTTTTPKETETVTRDQADRIIALLETIAERSLVTADALTVGKEGVKFDGDLIASLKAIPAATTATPESLTISGGTLTFDVAAPV